MFTLREKQIYAIKNMLNLNIQNSKAFAAEPIWKVLIYDHVGQDIISPIISVQELRELGVTLHVQLHFDRDSIPDVPAVYFCAPTDDNIDRIQQDIQNGLYDIYHLNFLAPISREKIESLASAAFQTGCVANIHRIYDQYVNFISIEDDFFILKHQKQQPFSFYSINKANTKNEELEVIMNAITESLFSVFVTLGSVPIIRCPRYSAAEMVARKLEKKFRENLWDAKSNLFHVDATQSGSGVFSFHRPVLLLLDRSIDLASPLHHTWSYQSLLHDVLDLSLNLVRIEDESSSPPMGGVRRKTKACSLDRNDRFWTTHKSSPFPAVAEAIQEELECYRSSEDEIKSLKTTIRTDGETEVMFSKINDATVRLTDAVNSLPVLIEKKRLIDMHTKIATSILNCIKARRLDSFFELEEKIMSNQALDRPILELIRDFEFGLPNDKMRLFLIYYICVVNVPDSELILMKEALKEAGCNLLPLTYVQRWKSFLNQSSIIQSPQYEGGGTKTVSMFTKLVSQGSSFLMEGVKNLVVKQHSLPVTKLTDQLMDGRSNCEIEDYLYLDPKLLRGGDTTPKHRAQFKDAVTFVVGGGNYTEYQNLVDYMRQRQFSNINKRIIYGSTTLSNSTQFLNDISELGREIQDPVLS